MNSFRAKDVPLDYITKRARQEKKALAIVEEVHKQYKDPQKCWQMIETKLVEAGVDLREVIISAKQHNVELHMSEELELYEEYERQR